MLTDKEMVCSTQKEGVIQWHPRLNVYILDNQDVLILSEVQKLLLPAMQFPLFFLVDGHKTASQILQLRNVQDIQKSGPFHYKMNQFVDDNLLVDSVSSDLYLRPAYDRPQDYDPMDNGVTSKKVIIDGCEVVNLSALSAVSVVDIELMLLRASKVVVAAKKIIQQISFIVIDDFTDPRITDLELDQTFMVIKFSGENVWISPMFSHTEMVLFSRLQ